MNLEFQVCLLPWILFALFSLLGYVLEPIFGECSPVIYAAVALWMIVIGFALAGKCPQVNSGKNELENESLNQLPCASLKVILGICVSMGIMISILFIFDWGYVSLLMLCVFCILFVVNSDQKYVHNCCRIRDGFSASDVEIARELTISETPVVVDLYADSALHFGMNVKASVLAAVPPGCPHSTGSFSVEKLKLKEGLCQSQSIQ